MKKFISIKFLGPMFALTVLALSYQNCSKVSVDTMESASIASTAGTSSPPDVICNPLSGATCDIDSKEGLIGNLYYLTQDQAPLFSNNLNNAKLADYITYGHKPDSLILMNEINVPAQDWSQGFRRPDGSLITDEQGNDLFEYFSIDLNGYINLPQGEYEFAFVSDDGMKMLVDGKEILVADSQHAPRWDCSSGKVSFNKDQKKSIRVQYFQGPRVQIAMQMFYRPVSSAQKSCDDKGGWMIVPASALSH